MESFKAIPIRILVQHNINTGQMNLSLFPGLRDAIDTCVISAGSWLGSRTSVHLGLILLETDVAKEVLERSVFIAEANESVCGPDSITREDELAQFVKEKLVEADALRQLERANPIWRYLNGEDETQQEVPELLSPAEEKEFDAEDHDDNIIE